MHIMDKLYNELELVEYTLDKFEREGFELSEKEHGILLGKQSVINDLIESLEKGNIEF